MKAKFAVCAIATMLMLLAVPSNVAAERAIYLYPDWDFDGYTDSYTPSSTCLDSLSDCVDEGALSGPGYHDGDMTTAFGMSYEQRLAVSLTNQSEMGVNSGAPIGDDEYIVSVRLSVLFFYYGWYVRHITGYNNTTLQMSLYYGTIGAIHMIGDCLFDQPVIAQNPRPFMEYDSGWIADCNGTSWDDAPTIDNLFVYITGVSNATFDPTGIRITYIHVALQVAFRPFVSDGTGGGVIGSNVWILLLLAVAAIIIIPCAIFARNFFRYMGGR